MNNRIFNRRLNIKFYKCISLIIASVFCVTALILVLCSCQGNGTATTDNTVKTNNVISNKKICFVPLDTRSITYDYPIKLASSYGINVIYPDMSQMTFHDDSADVSVIQSWTKNNASNCDALVVSAEQLVYGGLIQMRATTEDNGSRQSAMNLLREIKKDNPNIKIYLSNILMRTTSTVLDNESNIWWKKITEYYNCLYRAQILGDLNAQVEANKLKSEIPGKVLNDYLEARQAAYQVSKDCVSLIDEGVAEQLILYKEGNQTLGLEKIEQRELESEIASDKNHDKMTITNGDGDGSELMMVAAKTLKNDVQINLDVEAFGINQSMTALYEDCPFQENLQEHMSAMNINYAKGANNILIIFYPRASQGDYSDVASSGYEPYTDSEINEYADKIVSVQQTGKHCYLLDLDCANGGCTSLLKALGERNAISNLYGYSGWNTASNSLGTVLAQIVSSGDFNSVSNQVLTKERIIDDVVYQSNVRSALNKQLEAEGENIYNISDLDKADKYLQDEFKNQASLIDTIFHSDSINYKASFRWPRTFDISINIY